MCTWRMFGQAFLTSYIYLNQCRYFVPGALIRDISRPPNGFPRYPITRRFLAWFQCLIFSIHAFIWESLGLNLRKIEDNIYRNILQVVSWDGRLGRGWGSARFLHLMGGEGLFVSSIFPMATAFSRKGCLSESHFHITWYIRMISIMTPSNGNQITIFIGPPTSVESP